LRRETCHRTERRTNDLDITKPDDFPLWVTGASIMAYLRHVGLGGSLERAGCPVSQVEGIGFDVIQAPKPEPRFTRYELTDFEWAAIRPFLPNKPHGIGAS
jgi:hypothetical protein